MIGAFLALALSQQPPPPPPPLGTPDRLPAWRSVETAYQCGGEQVSFTVRYDEASRARVIRGRRGRATIPEASLRQVNARLLGFDSVASITPVCAGTVHTLTASGMSGGQPAEMVIVWTPHAVTPSPVWPPVAVRNRR
jgi:hypothetical protein